jgi:hypothetical protein
MRRVLFIVDRNARQLFAYVRDTLAGIGAEVEVIEDRRSGERRAESQPSQVERRQDDRRKDDVSRDLKRFGWVVVRRRDEAGSDGDKAP